MSASGRTGRARLTTLAAALLVLGLVAPRVLGQGSIFDPILDGLNQSSLVWARFFLDRGFAIRLYAICVSLQAAFFGYSLMWGSLRERAFPWDVLMRQLLILLFVIGILLAWPQWGTFVQQVLFGVGQNVTGLQGLSPETLAAQGLGMAAIFISPKFALATLPIFGAPYQVLMVASVLAIVAALVLIAVRAFVLTVESHVLVTIGPLPFALAGWAPTAPLADNYIHYSFRLGLEYMMLIFFVHMGSGLGQFWLRRLDAIPAWNQPAVLLFLLETAIASITWAWIAIRLPSKFAGLITGQWRPGIPQALRFA